MRRPFRGTRRIRIDKRVLGAKGTTCIVAVMPIRATKISLAAVIALLMAPAVCAQSLSDVVKAVREDSKRLAQQTPVLQQFPIEEGASRRSYFPGSVVDHTFHWDWYRQELVALQEKSLFSEGCEASHCVRFTWLRSFHAPIAIRVEFHTVGVAALYFKQGDGARGFEPGDLSISDSAPLDEATESEIVSLLHNILQNEKFTDAGPRGYDGARWIIEYRTNNRYVIVDQWSPTGGDIYALGVYLLNLSNFKGAARTPVY